jgi:hypothetical protein
MRLLAAALLIVNALAFAPQAFALSCDDITVKINSDIENRVADSKELPWQKLDWYQANLGPTEHIQKIDKFSQYTWFCPNNKAAYITIIVNRAGDLIHIDGGYNGMDGGGIFSREFTPPQPPVEVPKPAKAVKHKTKKHNVQDELSSTDRTDDPLNSAPSSIQKDVPVVTGVPIRIKEATRSNIIPIEAPVPKKPVKHQKHVVVKKALTPKKTTIAEPVVVKKSVSIQEHVIHKSVVVQKALTTNTTIDEPVAVKKAVTINKPVIDESVVVKKVVTTNLGATTEAVVAKKVTNPMKPIETVVIKKIVVTNKPTVKGSADSKKVITTNKSTTEAKIVVKKTVTPKHSAGAAPDITEDDLTPPSIDGGTPDINEDIDLPIIPKKPSIIKALPAPAATVGTPDSPRPSSVPSTTQQTTTQKFAPGVPNNNPQAVSPQPSAPASGNKQTDIPQDEMLSPPK